MGVQSIHPAAIGQRGQPRQSAQETLDMKTKTEVVVKTVKAAKEKKNICVCGCGEPCHRLFAPGHDQRVRGWLLRGEQLPKTLTSALADGRLNKDAFLKGHATPTIVLVPARLPYTPAPKKVAVKTAVAKQTRKAA